MLNQVVLSSLMLLVLSACSTPPQDGLEPGNPDAGIDVSEGEGEEGEGEEGEGEEGEGEAPDGEGEGNEGEGELGPVMGDLYTGAAEAGVVCDGNTCATDGACCLDFVGMSAACVDTLPCSGGFTVLPLVCDGPEDCADPALPVCCAQATGASCVADGACTGGFAFETCTDDTSCAVGSNCCSSSQLTGLGIDAGVCVAPNAAGERCVIQGAGG